MLRNYFQLSYLVKIEQEKNDLKMSSISLRARNVRILQTQNRISENKTLPKKNINGALAIIQNKLSILKKNYNFMISKTPKDKILEFRLKSKNLDSAKSNFFFYNGAIMKEAHITNIK